MNSNIPYWPSGPQWIAFDRNLNAFGFLRQLAERQFHHAQEVVPGEAIFVEYLKDQLVLVRFHPEDELFVPLGVEGFLLGFRQHRIDVLVAGDGVQVDPDVRVTVD